MSRDIEPDEDRTSAVDPSEAALPELHDTGPMPAITGPIPKVEDNADGRNGEEAVLRSSLLMASGTIISRITGVLRDTALTAALGLTIVRDAFALGNSLPSVVYILVVGGALNAVFVPQLVRRMKDDADGGSAYANSLLSATAAVLFVLSLVSVLAAPWIVALYSAPSYTDEQAALATTFARLCLPQIFFYGVFTMLSQVLNARGHFGMPMFAPIVNNLVAIATYVGFIAVVGTSAAGRGTLTPGQTLWLGVGTTLGVALQALVLIPVLRRTGFTYRFTTRWRGLGLSKAVHLATWTIALVLVNQIGFVVTSRLATSANVNSSAVGEAAAGLATYQTGYLIFILPHSVITVSIVTALLPNLSRTVHAGQIAQAGQDIGRSVRIIVLLIAPVAVALFLAAGPVASLLFGYGAADPGQIEALGTTTGIFAVGIIPFTVYYVLLRGWYAQEDTRTPFVMATIQNAVTITLSLLLYGAVGPGQNQVYALAVAFVAGYWTVLMVAWPLLSRRYGGLDTANTVVLVMKVMVAAFIALMAGLIVLSGYSTEAGKASAIVEIIVISLAVLVSYVLAAFVLRITEGRDLWQMVARRVRRRG